MKNKILVLKLQMSSSAGFDSSVNEIVKNTKRVNIHSSGVNLEKKHINMEQIVTESFFCVHLLEYIMKKKNKKLYKNV